MAKLRRPTDQSHMYKFVILLLFLILPFAGANASQRVDLAGRTVIEIAPILRTGEFVWAPEIAPTGPTLLIINRDTQRAVLFRNGVAIAATTLSTGRPGYETPTGVFTILQKHVVHYSSKYDNAPMPYMQRLTWRGVALHAGYLPGRPASHGCIRLPKEFARLLYGATTLGMTVVVTRFPASLRPTRDAPLALRSTSGAELTNAPFEWHPARSPYGLTSVIFSTTDQRAVVLRNGKIIGSSPVRIIGSAEGAWAYLLHRSTREGRQWLKLRLDGHPGGEMAVPADEVRRFQMPDGFRAAVVQVLRPGSIVIVTPEPLRLGRTGDPITVIEDEEGAPD